MDGTFWQIFLKLSRPKHNRGEVVGTLLKFPKRPRLKQLVKRKSDYLPTLIVVGLYFALLFSAFIYEITN